MSVSAPGLCTASTGVSSASHTSRTAAALTCRACLPHHPVIVPQLGHALLPTRPLHLSHGGSPRRSACACTHLAGTVSATRTTHDAPPTFRARRTWWLPHKPLLRAGCRHCPWRVHHPHSSSRRSISITAVARSLLSSTVTARSPALDSQCSRRVAHCSSRRRSTLSEEHRRRALKNDPNRFPT